MSNSKIDLGKVILQVLNLLIAKVFTLPWKIYKTSLMNLSDKSKSGEDNSISDDFPIYLWIINSYDAIIALIYPFGALGALVTFIETAEWDAGAALTSALGVLIVTYFAPLYAQLFKELFSISLRILQYLKDIASK